MIFFMRYFIISIFLICSNMVGQTTIFDKYVSENIEIYKASGEKGPYLVNRFKENKHPKSIFEYDRFCNYLMLHFSSKENREGLLEIEDNQKIEAVYKKRLAADTLFNTIVEEIYQKSIEKSIPKDTIKQVELLGIAVKFFSISKITPEGTYSVKVCVGINDIKSTELVRKPFIEAFAFSSIINNLRNPAYNLIDSFMKRGKELYEVNLGINENERILRAQGAIYFLMKNEPALRQLLLDEYKRLEYLLPFVLVE